MSLSQRFQRNRLLRIAAQVRLVLLDYGAVAQRGAHEI
jgi:hypothetical protein